MNVRALDLATLHSVKAFVESWDSKLDILVNNAGAMAIPETACILMSVGIWSEDGITSNALNSGAIATYLQKHTGGLRTPEHLRKTPQQGASTTVLLAASPLVDGISGKHFDDCPEAPIVEE